MRKQDFRSFLALFTIVLFQISRKDFYLSLSNTDRPFFCRITILGSSRISNPLSRYEWKKLINFWNKNPNKTGFYAVTNGKRNNGTSPTRTLFIPPWIILDSNFFPEFPRIPILENRRPINNFPNFTRIVHVSLLPFAKILCKTRRAYKYGIKCAYISRKKKKDPSDEQYLFTTSDNRPKINSLFDTLNLFLQPAGITLVFQQIRKILSHSWAKENISKTRSKRKVGILNG